MHKLYKPYLYGTITISGLLSIYTLICYEIEVTLLGVLIATFGLVLEVAMLRYSQNNVISFQGALAIFLVFNFNPATCVLITTLSIILETVIIALIKRELSLVLNIKMLYNWSMRIICILLAGKVYTFLQGFNTIVVIVIVVILYNIINSYLLAFILYLYTNNKEEAHVMSMHAEFAYTYMCAIINIMLFYGYVAYGVKGIIIIYMFLLPVQTSILGKTIVQEEIEKSIFIDSLTKAYNRASLTKILTDYLSSKTPFTIVFLDFDRFKIINDSFGHDIGDKILIQFVSTVKENLRKTDKLYRFGGDEFCLIINKDVEADAVLEKIKRLKKSLVFEDENLKIHYTFSIGKYTYTGQHDVTMGEIINYASHRMKENKVKMQKEYILEGAYVDSRLT